VDHGVLRVRARRGAVPEALAAPIVLADRISPMPALRVGTPVPTSSRRASGGSRCRYWVDDPHPPLNVRAERSSRSAIVGTLDSGAQIVPLRTVGAWIEIGAPFAGWLWSRNVRRECAQ